jgi:hypothetical protein
MPGTPLIQVTGTSIVVDTHEARRLRIARTAENKKPLTADSLASIKTIADAIPVLEALIVKCTRLQAEIDELRSRN